MHGEDGDEPPPLVRRNRQREKRKRRENQQGPKTDSRPPARGPDQQEQRNERYEDSCEGDRSISEGEIRDRDVDQVHGASTIQNGPKMTHDFERTGASPSRRVSRSVDSGSGVARSRSLTGRPPIHLGPRGEADAKRTAFAETPWETVTESYRLLGARSGSGANSLPIQVLARRAGPE